MTLLQRCIFRTYFFILCYRCFQPICSSDIFSRLIEAAYALMDIIYIHLMWCVYFYNRSGRDSTSEGLTPDENNITHDVAVSVSVYIGYSCCHNAIVVNIWTTEVVSRPETILFRPHLRTSRPLFVWPSPSMLRDGAHPNRH